MSFVSSGSRRKSTFFEKILLIIGLGVILLGFHFINSVYSAGLESMWGMVQAVFIWLVLIILVVLLATGEDIKEELSIIMRQQVNESKVANEELKLLKEETQLMKQITKDQREELKLIRRELEHHKYSH